MTKKPTVDSSQIIQLYSDGYSAKDIGSMLNFSAQTIRAVLRGAGFHTRAYRKVEQVNVDKIILLITAGYSYKQIEKLLHYSFHLIREVVVRAGLIGFAPKNHSFVKLGVQKDDVSFDTLRRLEELYSAGNFGLAKCAEEVCASDKEFLWFVFHLSDALQAQHNNQLKTNVMKMYAADVPVTAIAKRMNISCAIVKKMIKGLQ